MKGFHLTGDTCRLYFTAAKVLDDDAEFSAVMERLTTAGCRIGLPFTAPDCDIFPCRLEAYDFTVIRTLDGNGTYLHCNIPQGMQRLEQLFDG